MAGAAGDHPWRGLVPRYHAPLVAPAWVRVQNVAPVVVDGWVGGAFSWSCSWRPVPTIHTCDRLDWLGLKRTGIMPFDLHCSPLFLLSSLRDLDRPRLHHSVPEDADEGGTRKRTRRDRGASSESCLFRVRSVDSLSLLSSSSSPICTRPRSRFLSFLLLDVYHPLEDQRAAHRNKLCIHLVCVVCRQKFLSSIYLSIHPSPLPQILPSISRIPGAYLPTLPRTALLYSFPTSQVNRCSCSAAHDPALTSRPSPLGILVKRRCRDSAQRHISIQHRPGSPISYQSVSPFPAFTPDS